MIVLVVLLWVCGIMPGTCQIPDEIWLPTLRESAGWQTFSQVVAFRTDPPPAQMMFAEIQQLLPLILASLSLDRRDGAEAAAAAVRDRRRDLRARRPHGGAVEDYRRCVRRPAT
jgi:hypothetical protein